jgi:hypothetical protein
MLQWFRYEVLYNVYANINESLCELSSAFVLLGRRAAFATVCIRNRRNQQAHQQQQVAHLQSTR